MSTVIIIAAIFWLPMGIAASIIFNYEDIKNQKWDNVMPPWAWVVMTLCGAFSLSFVITRARHQYKENSARPIAGSYVKITWLPGYNGKSPNAYIGMTGKVEDLNEDGSFALASEHNVLIIGKRYQYEYLTEQEYLETMRPW